MDAFAERKGVCVVVELQLILASLSIIDSADTRVLLVEPRALNVRLLLGIVGLGVNLTNKVGNLVDSLLLEWACVTTSKSLLSLVKVSSCSCGSLRHFLSEVVVVFSAEVASLVVGAMVGDNSAEAGMRGLDGPVDEGELSDVVLVDHAQHWLLLADVRLRFLNFLLVRRLQLPLRHRRKLRLALRQHIHGSLTKPSSGIRCMVSCLGLRLMEPRGAGRPLEVRQLISGSLSRFYNAAKTHNGHQIVLSECEMI